MVFCEDDTHVLAGDESDVVLPEDTLGKRLLESLKEAPENCIAMIDAFTQEELLYTDFLYKIINLASSLRHLGYQGQNTVLGICSENCLDYFVPQFAAYLNLSIAAPVNHNYTLYELEHAFKISSPKVMFCSKETLGKIMQLKKSLTCIEKVVVLGKSEDVNLPSGVSFLDDFIRIKPCENIEPLKDQGDKTVAIILCSSGTTGLPKEVALSHLCLTACLIQFKLRTASIDEGQFQMGLMPFFHSFGNTVATRNLLKAKTTISFKRFDEDIYLKTIQDYKLISLGIAPPLALFLAKSSKVTKYNLSSVTTIICGAAPMSKTVESEVMKRLPNCKEVRQAYGLTEMTLTVTVVPPGVVRAGSSGTLLSYLLLKVMDPETGKSLGPHQVGEICLKGPTAMMGYYNNSQATKDTFTPKGWLRTGDLGYYDEDEYLYIVDRLKELIKYKGFQVAPAELEGVLINHPDVVDVGVVGLPDFKVGERPLAFIVKKSGSQISETDIKKYVSGLLSHQKRLSGGVIFVDSIPKNPSGKILRRELKELLRKHYNSKL